MAVIVPNALHSTATTAVTREREESMVPMMATTARVASSGARVAISSAPTTAKAAISSAREVSNSARAAISSVPTTVKAAISSAKAVTSHVPVATRSAPRATILMPSTA